MENCKGFSSPLQVGCINIDKDTEKKFCQSIYRKAVGCLLYLSSTTRPDIANSVCIVSQYCEDPTITDWNNIKHIFQYLKKTKGYGLHFCRTNKETAVFTDSDWATNKTDNISISGYCFILAGGAICWRSKKQSRVAPSSTHSEYAAMYECVSEFEWLRDFLHEIGQEDLMSKPCAIYADNASAIYIASSQNISDKTKNISVKYHYSRELVKAGEVTFVYVESSKNLADVFTKPLSGPKTKEFAKLLGVY